MDNYLDWTISGAVNMPPVTTSAPSMSGLAPVIPGSAQAIHNDPNHRIDLALENVVDDDFSFFALQHFSGDQILAAAPHLLDPGADLFSSDWLTTPAAPCTECMKDGFLCKLVQQGQYKGLCSSCVAVGQSCSFSSIAPEPPGSQFLQNSWNSFNSNADSNMITKKDLIDSLQIPQPLPSHVFTEVQEASEVTDCDAATEAQTITVPAKIGARFSRASVRVLRNWLSTHSRHPYPSDEEKEMLQRQTGLNKTQITNWLANARRRGKVQMPARSTSPHPQAWSNANANNINMNIPRRTGPPLETMNPLQRWANSPPEHEPASAIDIARAVTESTASSTQASSYNYTDDGSGRSLHGGSSVSSTMTSRSSGGSFASAFSHGSSVGSFSSFPRGRRRRRRRGAVMSIEKTNLLRNPLRTFQCTFCPETFKTKHDWQRHEKSLHLSLERWVCSPNGVSAINPHNGAVSCVFCSEADPTEAHMETHNCSACLDKSLEERTFYRKDHLNQHLRLVHNVRFVDWSMKNWRVAAPTIRSRCGFCGIVMDTWATRVEHLSEHFKSGSSMADWKGDWGFDRPILDLVENSIPPYLIDIERNSPYPMGPEQAPPESPRNAYELIKDEMVYFMANRAEKNAGFPTDDQLRVEACRIIFASEVLSLQGISSMSSWLRDVLMADESLAHQAKFGPLRTQAENRLAILKINGKDNLFEACPLERALQDFVVSRQLLGLTPLDSELQEEACRIVSKVEKVSTHPSEIFANFLLRLIKSDTKWLASFRHRAHLPRSEEIGDMYYRSTDPATIDSTIHNYSRLERELSDYLASQRKQGIDPTNEDLQRKARIIIYEFDDGWNQTAADSIEWLNAFKDRHPWTAEHDSAFSTSAAAAAAAAAAMPPPAVPGKKASQIQSSSSITERYSTGDPMGLLSDPMPRSRIGTFLNDSNCFRRLKRELTRYVTMSMSDNNPNKHVPTDQELQHQARWIVYDDDDPWNQTAADNVEWLRRFKRGVRLLNDNGPGLSPDNSWSVSQGGSGFAPPFAYPKHGFTEHVTAQPIIDVDVRGKKFGTGGPVAGKFLESLSERYPRPAIIFCSRELEKGLTEFISGKAASGEGFPDNAALQAEARKILGTSVTAADDIELLEMFRKMIKERMSRAVESPTRGDQETGSKPSEAPGPSTVGATILVNTMESTDQDMGIGMDMESFNMDEQAGGLTEQEIEDLLCDISFDFAMESV